MPSRDSSRKRGNDAPDALAGKEPAQHRLRPDRPVQTIEEFVAFLAEVEAVVGRDDRPRPPTRGTRFRL